MTSPTRRHATRTTLLATALAGAFAFAAPFAAADKHATIGHDQFIVRFKDGSPEHRHAATRQLRLDAAGRAQGLHLGQLRRLAVGADVIRTDRRLDAAEATALISRLRADPRVAYAEIDTRVLPAFTPDDPQYVSQWHYSEALAGIRLPGAWDVTGGAGEVVAVIDTGVTAHPDLADNLLPGYDFIADTAVANDGDGRDADPSDPGDWTTNGQCGPYAGRPSSWHGTHVAGTIAAVTHNATGVAGVAFDAKVLPLRVLGRCGGFSSDINDAIVWAAGGTVAGVPANPTPAKVINLSLGGSGACLASTQAAIDAAVANGATVVVAAGNNNSDAGNFQPASCNNVITVAAAGRGGARATYSNYGAVVDIAAPGGDGPESVVSTLNAGTTVPGAASYGGYNGTSMAAPHVAGVAALARAASGGTLTPAEVKTLLEVTARTLPVACAQGCGAGLVDAHAAVVAATTPVLMIQEPVVVDEGDAGTHALAFTVRLSQPVAADVVFDIATADGTATADDDYVAQALPAQVIPAGSTAFEFVVVVNGDTLPEDDESFAVEVDNVTGPVTVIGDTGTGRIPNDESVELTPNVPVVVADSATGHRRYFTMDVPANAGNLKFSLSGGAGNADLAVRFGARPDDIEADCFDGGPWDQYEDCEVATQAGTWHVAVEAVSSYAGVTLVGSYTLLPEISISDASVVEGNGGVPKKMTFTVSRAQVSGDPVYFEVRDRAGTAEWGDYFPAYQYGLWIEGGQKSKTFTVDIQGDNTPEEDETFVVALENVNGGYVVDGEGTGTIVDDDTPLLSIGDAMVTEGNSGTKVLTFVVRLSQPSLFPTTYDIATSDFTAVAGSDYEAASRTGETIPAGQLSKTFSVTLLGDTEFEANEFLYATLSSASTRIADAQGLGIIHNDEGPTLSINDAGYQEGHSGIKTQTFTVSLSQVSTVPVTFTIATGGGTAISGIDYYGFAPRNVTIPAGQLSKIFLVTTQGDPTIEGNETFFVYLSNASVSVTDSQGRGSIINDDGPTLSIRDAPEVREPSPGQPGIMTFTVELSQAMSKPATFNLSTANGTAIAGSDFRSTSVIGATIPAGQTSLTFSVQVYGDFVSEGPETVQANLSMGNVSIVDGVGIGRIR